MKKKLLLGLSIILVLLVAGGGFYYARTDYRMTMNGLESLLRTTQSQLREMDMTPSNTIRTEQIRSNMYFLNDMREKCVRIPDWAVSAEEKNAFLRKIEILEAECNNRLTVVTPSK